MKSMMICCLWACSIGVLLAASIDPFEQEWTNFKQKYGKSYRTEHEEQSRKQIFADNLELINNHNSFKFEKGLSSYQLGVNHFADLTNPEFRRQVTGCIDSKRAIPESNQYVDNSVKDLPDEVDWTKKGVVAPIKNQGNCGSCWAFSAVASMESQHALHSGKLVELSEQELVDCSFQAEGCEGGWPIDGFKFAIQNKGMDTEASYPYKAVDQTCQDSIRTRDIGARFTNYSTIASGDENALQSATAKVGPISVLIDASSSKFQHYKSGVYDNEDCAQDWLDHAVTVVGYGTLEGTQYWKVKNSWGTDWGMAGYVLMSRNKDNQCGIATSASYPIV